MSVPRALLCMPFILAAASAYSQQPPRLDQVPGQAPGGMERPVRLPPPRASQPNNAELAELLRAQTAAIKSLSQKVDALDARLRKIEER